MSALDRDKARDLITEECLLRTHSLSVEEILDRLEECVPYGWESVWQDLNDIYAEEIIPTRHVSADDGNGPQVVSLLRLLGRAEAKLAAITDELNRHERDTRLTERGAMHLTRLRLILRGGVA